LNRGRGGRSGQQDRRVEQRRVLADIVAARPRGLDEDRYERLGDRLARRDLDDGTAIAARNDTKLEVAEKRRAVEALASERFGTRKSDLERLELFGRRRQLDLGAKRLIQGGLDLERPKSERPCSGGSGQQWRDGPTCP
jgi:hypothetical protein